MLLGYNSVASRKLAIHDIYFINADGEVSELISIFKKKQLVPDSAKSFAANEMRLKEDQSDIDNLKQKLPENIVIGNETVAITEENAFMINLFKKYNTTDPNVIWLKKLSHSHCSALVKLLFDE